MTRSVKFLGAVACATLLLLASCATADNMGSIGVAPASGEVTLTKQWAIGTDLTGLRVMLQDLSLGGGPTNFYSIKGTAIPAGGDTQAFSYYASATGVATFHADIGSKLTPDSYSALTAADPDLGFGSINFYTIHHRGATDYFAVIVPGPAAASAVLDLKPMSGPGGPLTITGVSGYFAMTFAAADVGYGANLFYYLRTTGTTTTFGSLAPALLSTSTDLFDLGAGAYNAIAFTGDDIGYGVNQIYYLKLDPITGFTIFGTLNPGTGEVEDIANLGSVFTTIDYTPANLGFGTSKFYTTGPFNPTFQTISFAAIDDRMLTDGSFTVEPTASSGLALTLTVVVGSTGAATISAPVNGVFTVTPTAPGVIILQATQAGQLAPVEYEYNMLRQAFTVDGGTVAPTTAAPISSTTSSPVVVTVAPGTTGTTTAPVATLAPAATTATPAGTTATPAGTTATPAGTTAGPAHTTVVPCPTPRPRGTRAPKGTHSPPATPTPPVVTPVPTQRPPTPRPPTPAPTLAPPPPTTTGSGLWWNCNSVIAIPGNPYGTTNAQCSKCNRGAQSWYPCDNPALCYCQGSTIPPQYLLPFSNCANVVAVAGQYSATNSQCAMCNLGTYRWWPCEAATVNVLCRCATSSPGTNAPPRC